MEAAFAQLLIAGVIAYLLAPAWGVALAVRARVHPGGRIPALFAGALALGVIAVTAFARSHDTYYDPAPRLWDRAAGSSQALVLAVLAVSAIVAAALVWAAARPRTWRPGGRAGVVAVATVAMAAEGFAVIALAASTFH